jgi:hypothetical protein
MFVSAVVAFAAFAFAMAIANPPEFIAVVGTVSILYGLFFVLIAAYLKHSTQPLV